jgi:hypothetical protein
MPLTSTCIPVVPAIANIAARWIRRGSAAVTPAHRSKATARSPSALSARPPTPRHVSMSGARRLKRDDVAACLAICERFPNDAIPDPSLDAARVRKHAPKVVPYLLERRIAKPPNLDPSAVTLSGADRIFGELTRGHRRCFCTPRSPRSSGGRKALFNSSLS